MSKKLILIIVVIVLAGLAAFNFKFLKRYYHVYFKTDTMFVSSDTDEFTKGPKVGSTFPAINASYQGAKINSVAQFNGLEGTVFIINRSLEWCPYCMRQAIELQAVYTDFKANGINLVMMTYDTPELQAAFISRHGIKYPVLSDINAESFKALGVLREDISPGERHYGLPYPGMIVLDSSGVIRGKLFIEAYSTRVDSNAVLKISQDWLNKD